MVVLYFQLLIIGSILAASTQTCRRWLRWSHYSPLEAAALVAAGWSLFTVAFVFTNQLMAAQLLTIWGTVGVLWRLHKQSNDLERMRRELAQLSPQALDRFSRSKRAGAVRPLNGRPEHRRVLQMSLEEARCSVVILSGWVNDYVIDQEFKRRLTDALARGVDVYIGYGYTSSKQPAERSETEKRAIRFLEDLARRCEGSNPGQLFIAEWPNHAKILICDEAYAVCGSYNWLSNARGINDERSWLVTDPDFVRFEREEIIQRLQARGRVVQASTRSSAPPAV